MKKTLALVLAGVMAAGMATTAFAVDADEIGISTQTVDNFVYVDSDDDGKFTSKESVGGFKTGNNMSTAKLEGDKKVAIPLRFLIDGDIVTDKDDIRGYKVKTEWTVGELDDKATIEHVKIDNTWLYAVTFTLPESAVTKDSDLAGEIAVYKNSRDIREGAANRDDRVLNFGTTFGYNSMLLGTDSYAPHAGTSLYAGLDYELEDAEIVEFKEMDSKGAKVNLEGEEVMTLGDIFEFEVDVTGQGKLNLKNNQDFNKEFAAMYDYANIDFLTFEFAPTFNKIGTAWIYAPEDAFIYEVTADGAKEIKGLEWDEDYEAWTFRTRTLGSYAISDVELDEKTVTEDKDDTTTDGGKVNPDTGR